MASDDLDLNEIIALGGTREDYDMLKNLETKSKKSLPSKREIFKVSDSWFIYTTAYTTAATRFLCFCM